MIDSLLEELSQRGAIEDDQTASTSDATTALPSEKPFLAALPVVQQVVRRRRSRLDPTHASDLVQEVALRIWRWATNHQEKSEQMSKEEWQAFAARTAYNEVSRYFSGARTPFVNVDPDNISAIETAPIEGQSESEVFSLIRAVWQGICQLSLRQRWALLLHSQELIIYFLQSGISEEELAGVLEFEIADWYEIRDRLPMTDAQIANGLGRKRRSARISSTASSVKKARHDARVKLKGLIRK